jgi:DeoR/GlpR family transcriptional regulator of sugar metabolism
VLENTTVPVLAVRTKLSPSTLRRQIADMMQQELVEEIIVKRKQGGTGLLTYTLLKEVKDDLY